MWSQAKATNMLTTVRLVAPVNVPKMTRSTKLTLNALADAVNLPTKTTTMSDLGADYSNALLRSIGMRHDVTLPDGWVQVRASFYDELLEIANERSTMTNETNDSRDRATTLDTPQDVSRETRNDRQDVGPSYTNGDFSASPTIGKLVQALALAQADFKPIKKLLENPVFKSRYADLDAVIDATRPALSKNGLVVMQFPQSDIGRKVLTMKTRLAHESGEWIESSLTLPATMRDQLNAQTVGSAMTYARRYAWQAIVGVASEIDDDATTASDSGSKQAADDVAKRKLKEANQAIPALFYQLHAESGFYSITGAPSLLNATRDLLKPFWKPAVGLHIVNDEELEGLKYEMDKRHIEFRVLKAK